MNLPKPYIDCVIKRSDGQIRVGRLCYESKHWQIASYQIRKIEVVWSVDDVIAFEEINLDI
jgi:hypothetical protein